jgi:hypothetical protein
MMKLITKKYCHEDIMIQKIIHIIQKHENIKIEIDFLYNLEQNIK